MAKHRHSAERVIHKLRQADVELGKGQSVEQATGGVRSTGG